MSEITLRKSGGSLTATLPKAMAERYNLQAGDRISIVEAEEGILLTPYDPDFDIAMQAYKDGARKYRNALRELAK